jgi:hypothetical protein
VAPVYGRIYPTIPQEAPPLNNATCQSIYSTSNVVAAGSAYLTEKIKNKNNKRRRLYTKWIHIVLLCLTINVYAHIYSIYDQVVF